MSRRIHSHFPDGNSEEVTSNPSPERHFNELLERRFSRRALLRGGIHAAFAGFVATSGVAALTRTLAPPARLLASPGSAGAAGALAADSLLGFDPVPIYNGDGVLVARGYTARPFLPAGTPICGSYPPYLGGGRNSGADQECQVGHHHDGMHFFPLGEGEEQNRHGILCLNHEYVDVAKLHPEGPAVVDGARTVPDEVRKEVAAHGVSVVEIARNDQGDWEVVRGRYNRRITAETPMVFSGPVRGSHLVRTKHSPEGTEARGTLNNCAHGVTPWNTYLTCEENWAFYFVNRGDNPREHDRYSIGADRARYGWATLQDVDAYARFDASIKGDSPAEDYRNEPNTQGWIVEIDPFDPEATPVKRTALGRFAHEGCWAAPAVEGRPLTFYMGDDARNEYIYKFVTAAPYQEGVTRGEILDEGTLYAARFDEDGSGTWLPLAHGDPAFEAACGEKGVAFADQAEVLVNTRLAADVMGATPMDRPEWTVVHPDTGEVFCTLTNNTRRGDTVPVDAANPRARNAFGHIIRWREEGDQHEALDFHWDLFVLAGPPEDSEVRGAPGRPPLDETNMFASPDGLWIDPRGVLWIEMDMGTDQQVEEFERFGNNALLAADPVTGDIRRFLVGCRGQEVTGCIATPDSRTLFINLQHPGEGSEENPILTSHWPDGDEARPRSAVVVITKDDGGIVGS
jgi:secreted PhoX family phosphatase